MSQTEPKKYYTHQEYLSLEESQEWKSEYYRGEIFAMAGASVNHNLITNNLYRTLYGKSKNCMIFTSDMRLRVERHDLDTYPDLMVVCDKIQFFEGRDDTLTNPVVIAEVLSKSTEAYDRGKKFEFYRSLPSLREYLLIDQYQIHVEQFLQSEGKTWMFKEYHANEEIELPTLGLLINSNDLYTEVVFEPESHPE